MKIRLIDFLILAALGAVLFLGLPQAVATDPAPVQQVAPVVIYPAQPAQVVTYPTNPPPVVDVPQVQPTWTPFYVAPTVTQETGRNGLIGTGSSGSVGNHDPGTSDRPPRQP